MILPNCIIILYHNLLYSLIYFIFRDDTYVISSIFASLMIIGELTARVRILLEKGPSRHHISEEQQFPKNTQMFLFYQMPKEARRGASDGLGRAHTTPRRRPLPGRAWASCGGPGSHLTLCLRVFHPP